MGIYCNMCVGPLGIRHINGGRGKEGALFETSAWYTLLRLLVHLDIATPCLPSYDE